MNSQNYDNKTLSEVPAGGAPDEFIDERSIVRFLPRKWEKDITIFVPCYNEEGNIVDTFDTLIPCLEEAKLSWEIIVVDDASTDGSIRMIRRYMQEHPGYDIKLRTRKENIGLAQNYIDGAFMASGRYYKLVCGDNPEPKETLSAIFKALDKDVPMVIPYPVTIEGRSFLRHIFSKTYTFLVNAMSGHKLKYYNGCAVLLTYNVMRWHTDYHGFSFQADIITRLLNQGMSYVEIPANYTDRKHGTSKAYRLKNFLSVGHFFLDLAIRRIGIMYHSKNANKKV